MYKTFTQNDLIRFLYNEMTSEESILLREALLNDWIYAKLIMN